MLEEFPTSIAVGSSGFAPKLGSAGGYDDDQLWSVGLAKNIEQGIGYSIDEEGFYYAEMDTLNDVALLPAAQRTSTLRQLLISDTSTGRRNRAYFAEVGDRLFMALGYMVYEWDYTNLAFNIYQQLAVCVTSMVYFDGYLHITGDGDYYWLNPATKTGGQLTLFQNASLVHHFGGLLYVALGNVVRYTNGSGWVYGDSGYPANPTAWTWTDPIEISVYGEEITGMAGLIYQQIGQRYIWVSTPSTLTAILPGDTPYGITQWPASDERNGIDMVEFYDMVLISLDGSVVSLRGNGDVNGIDVGGKRGLPCERMGDVTAIFSAANYPMVAVGGEVPTVWANHNSGWHYVAKANSRIVGGHHSSRAKANILVCIDGTVVYQYTGDTSRNPVGDVSYRYTEVGIIDLGWYAGALFEADKYWREVFADVVCGEGTIEVLYRTEEAESCSSCNFLDYEAWDSAGFITSAAPYVKLPRTLVSKRIRVALRITGNNSAVSPSVRAMGVRYAPRVRQRRRWSFTVSLPRECMFDVTGLKLDGYSQQQWDEALWLICQGTHPVTFKDIDLKEYEVLVDNSNRTISDLGCVGEEFRYEISYSLSLVEAG